MDPCKPSGWVDILVQSLSCIWAPWATSCTQSNGTPLPPHRSQGRGKKGPLVLRCCWLWLWTLLQRERGRGGHCNQQEERFTGEQQKGEQPKPCRRLTVHEQGACRRARKGRGRLRGRQTDRLHCRRGHFLQSANGLRQRKYTRMPYKLERPSRFPQGKPLLLPATFPTMAFSCFLHFGLLGFF